MVLFHLKGKWGWPAFRWSCAAKERLEGVDITLPCDRANDAFRFQHWIPLILFDSRKFKRITTYTLSLSSCRAFSLSQVSKQSCFQAPKYFYCNTHWDRPQVTCLLLGAAMGGSFWRNGWTSSLLAWPWYLTLSWYCCCLVRSYQSEGSNAEKAGERKTNRYGWLQDTDGDILGTSREHRSLKQNRSGCGWSCNGLRSSAPKSAVSTIEPAAGEAIALFPLQMYKPQLNPAICPTKEEVIYGKATISIQSTYARKQARGGKLSKKSTF
jgi:hypothetical protein